MMRKPFLWIVAIVLIANGLALVAVARNGRGAVDAVITLTEREMRLTNMGTDTTGMTLTLQWNRRTPMPWFDRAKLVSLGFDCSMPPDAPDALDHYSGPWMLPRAVYVVFEYDPTRIDPDVAVGESQASESSGAERIAEKTPPEFLPRLRPVDAGNDPLALRSRYADRHQYLITAGTVRPNLVRATASRPATLQGQVLWVDPIQVYVPQEMQPTIVDALGKEGNRQPGSSSLTHAPRYEVTVEYGSSHLPRIVAVTKLGSPSSTAALATRSGPC